MLGLRMSPADIYLKSGGGLNALMLALAFAIAPSSGLEEEPRTVEGCTAQRLRPFARATGVRQPWPVTRELPGHLAGTPGQRLAEPGILADGYSHTLFVDVAAREAYLVQQGGFAGFQTIYGPLPVAWCLGQETGSE